MRRHVAWRFLSLCASLSFLGRHLVLAACWQRGLRRAQVRGPRFPCPGVSVSRYRRIPAGLSRAGRRGSLILSPWAVLGRSPRRGRASDPLVRGLPWLAGPRLSRGVAVTRAWRDEPCSPPAPRALGCPPSRPEPLLRRPAGSLRAPIPASLPLSSRPLPAQSPDSPVVPGIAGDSWGREQRLIAFAGRLEMFFHPLWVFGAFSI